MIRITFLLRRQAQLTAEAFSRYWREEHGPLVAGHAQRLNVLRYVQVHTLDDPINAAMASARGGMEVPYDGVAELWFENRDALIAALESEPGQRAAEQLLADEARFIDLPNSPLWIAHEYPQVNSTPETLVANVRDTIVKLYYPLRCYAGRDEAQEQHDWHTNHGPLIRRQAAGSGILRYVQVHRTPDALEAQLREPRGVKVEGYMGHAELWFDRSALQITTPERRIAGERAIEDEQRFIDFKRSSIWLGKEHVLVDNR